jgi:hypothetical protein
MWKVVSFALASTLALGGCGHSEAPGSAYSSGTGGSTSSSETGTGGESGTGCTTASISVDGDGPTNHLGAACMGSWGAKYTSYANGYLSYPAPNSGDSEQLVINGCVNTTASPMFGSFSLSVPQTTVGSATMGSASYANGLDTFATDTDVTVMVTQIDSKVVKGSFTANVSSTNNGMKMLSGSFSVCRVSDLLPP